jgi:hypothetical protein
VPRRACLGSLRDEIGWDSCETSGWRRPRQARHGTIGLSKVAIAGSVTLAGVAARTKDDHGDIQS